MVVECKNEKLLSELKAWKNTGLVKKAVEEWDSASLARALVAFLLN